MTPAGQPVQIMDRRALVLYGSETGNAQEAAEEIGRIAERLHFDTEVAEMNSVELRQLRQFTVVIFAISTTGQGDLPPNSQLFWRALRSVRLRPGSLAGVRFTTFGLGDSSYPKFNFASRKLHNRLLQLGADPFSERGESDEQHPEGIDGTFIPWSLQLRGRLLELFPLPDGIEPIPDNVLLPPKWILDFAEAKTETPFATSGANDVTAATPPPDDLIPIPESVIATVESNHRLTPESHWQDVRHLKLTTTEDVTYYPGDVCAIHPKNFAADVSHFLQITGSEEIADKPVRVIPGNVETSNSNMIAPFSNQTITLRTLLTNHLDIMAIPRRSLFAQLAHYTTNEFQHDRLLELTNPALLDELYDYTTRPRRSVMEVLQEFDTVHVPWQRLLSILPPLRPRQFSIASGGALKRATDDKTTCIELLVAIVRYRTVIRRIRRGVCTRYIAALQPGQHLRIKVLRGSLRMDAKDYQRPILMVGPGTGVAPLRSLIYEKLARGSAAGCSDSCLGDVLFFGSRNREADYFFKDEWTLLEGKGKLTVFTAFSRDQREKVYVQDLIREQSELAYNILLLKDGMVYVCGSSGKMPQAIREALIECFQVRGSLDRIKAESVLVEMEKSGRYKQETW
ncbi:NADPH dependent diflavin oxidoreductase-like protein 1 [Lineolata rhizophorae]|uniref:NADPH-dependent diflavin oxidoreductase 1 n=1 Tax=Lineolata rhizophorae TaxID=578093 RepID=A0A6A6NXK0_9PEZI|nr:NADPH dependent diflavin oxidoreductase-like protein 1 [Lineolata rhizophorae]